VVTRLASLAMIDGALQSMIDEVLLFAGKLSERG
jgi:hypothetical protein